jgi:hypothetical protein
MFNLLRSFPGRALGTLLGASATLSAAPPRFAAMRPMFMPTPMAASTPVFRVMPRAASAITPLPNSQMLVNPAFQVAPGLTLNQAAFNARVIAHTLRQFPPYLFGSNPYGSSMAYSNSMGMGYGGSYQMMMYGGSGYSGGSSAPAAMPDVSPAPNVMPATGGYGTGAYGRIEGKGVEAGVFAGLLKDDGRLDWPLALRILPPGFQTKAWRERLDARVAQLQTQAAEGKVDAALLKEAKGDLNKLGEILADRDGLLPVTQDAMGQAKDFVRQLRDALKALE